MATTIFIVAHLIEHRHGSGMKQEASTSPPIESNYDLASLYVCIQVARFASIGRFISFLLLACSRHFSILATTNQIRSDQLHFGSICLDQIESRIENREEIKWKERRWDQARSNEMRWDGIRFTYTHTYIPLYNIRYSNTYKHVYTLNELYSE